jgi:tetratricopeptide (TPR) repeat protein
LEEELAATTSLGNRFAEKMSLDNLGLASSEMGDPARSLVYYARALAIARDVGDRQHEADLLWLSAVQYAELGQREQAVAMGQEAAALFAQLGHPHAGILTDHLRRYRTGDERARLAQTLVFHTAHGSFSSHSLPGLTSTQITSDDSPEAVGANGPGLLRMAFSAAKSVARFLASGLRTTTALVQKQRLETCASCPHHTGTRCRLCGCFTRAKVIMPHEKCPIGKWSS